jgi:hypothetical protein
MDKKTNKLIERLLKGGRKELIKYGDVPLKAFLIKDNQPTHLLNIDMEEGDNFKDKLKDILVRLVKNTGVDGIVILSDSWVSLKEDMIPHLDPDRQECILLVYENINGDRVVIEQFYKRIEHKIKFGKQVRDNKGSNGGRFTNFFEQEPEEQLAMVVGE